MKYPVRAKLLAMKKFSTILFGFFVIAILAGIISCNNDDDDDDGNLTTRELLIGTWSVSDFDLNIRVGNRTLIDYLVEVEGFSPDDAAAQVEFLEAILATELTGTITFRSDNTYVSNFGEGSTSGTWSLSGDEKTLTLTEEGTDNIVMAIISITSTTFRATISESSAEDLDDDPLTPDVIISLEILLTLTK